MLSEQPLNLDHLTHADPRSLLATMQTLRQVVYDDGQQQFQQWQSRIQRPDFRFSALNLAYYLALRHHDLRGLQAALMPWGLSSLGRLEARVMPNLDAVIATLGAICQLDTASHLPRPVPADFFEGDRYLQQRTADLFGQSSGDRRVRIMVTLPTAAAESYELVRDLVQRGMSCARINCAHDTASDWQAMIRHIRRAEAETDRTCKVLMDLGGPKPRTTTVFYPSEQKRVTIGDCIWLSRQTPSVLKPEPVESTELPPHHFQTSCTIPEILDALEVGQHVWIDDGKLCTKVVETSHVLLPSAPPGVLLQVIQANPKGVKLKPEKGMNFPETRLPLRPLTEQDLQHLDLVVAEADSVGYSFVQTAEDIAQLQAEIAMRSRTKPSPFAIIAKIETPTAVHNLPDLIVQAAGQQPFGVMIARGDLAIEIGYQRLAEIQEEILWLCEAAHIPVIWATQVLENLVKTGAPSRGEMTDAAMAERAECVMLNKGEFIREAVTILDDVLTRMQAHQLKKTAQLRALHSW